MTTWRSVLLVLVGCGLLIGTVTAFGFDNRVYHYEIEPLSQTEYETIIDEYEDPDDRVGFQYSELSADAQRIVSGALDASDDATTADTPAYSTTTKPPEFTFLIDSSGYGTGVYLVNKSGEYYELWGRQKGGYGLGMSREIVGLGLALVGLPLFGLGIRRRPEPEFRVSVAVGLAVAIGAVFVGLTIPETNQLTVAAASSYAMFLFVAGVCRGLFTRVGVGRSTE